MYYFCDESLLFFFVDFHNYAFHFYFVSTSSQPSCRPPSRLLQLNVLYVIFGVLKEACIWCVKCLWTSRGDRDKPTMKWNNLTKLTTAKVRGGGKAGDLKSVSHPAGVAREIGVPDVHSDALAQHSIEHRIPNGPAARRRSVKHCWPEKGLQTRPPKIRERLAVVHRRYQRPLYHNRRSGGGPRQSRGKCWGPIRHLTDDCSKGWCCFKWEWGESCVHDIHACGFLRSRNFCVPHPVLLASVTWYFVYCMHSPCILPHWITSYYSCILMDYYCNAVKDKKSEGRASVILPVLSFN
jgi:hypothetical protein